MATCTGKRQYPTMVLLVSGFFLFTFGAMRLVNMIIPTLLRTSSRIRHRQRDYIYTSGNSSYPLAISSVSLAGVLHKGLQRRSHFHGPLRSQITSQHILKPPGGTDVDCQGSLGPGYLRFRVESFDRSHGEAARAAE